MCLAKLKLFYPIRTYCETDIDPHHRKLTQLQAVVRYLTGKEPDLECEFPQLYFTLFYNSFNADAK